MSDLLYVIGDIHGEYEMFQTLLKDYDETYQQLVLIGDLLDRGARSKECLLLGKQLVEEKRAIYLKGNHEDIFLRFLDDPEERYPNYILNGGGETIESLLHTGAVAEYSPTEISMLIKSRYKELISFLRELPLYYEWYDYLFVHAGINLEKDNWQDTSERDFLWIRKEFHGGKIIQIKQLFSGTRQQCTYLTTPQQLNYGKWIEKSGLMVAAFMAALFMEWSLIHGELFKTLNYLMNIHGNQNLKHIKK